MFPFHSVAASWGSPMKSMWTHFWSTSARPVQLVGVAKEDRTECCLAMIVNIVHPSIKCQIRNNNYSKNVVVFKSKLLDTKSNIEINWGILNFAWCVSVERFYL